MMYSGTMTTVLDIGLSLAPVRRAAGISQRELAVALGTSQQQIARWEATGYRTASLERVDATAQALGIVASAVTLTQPMAAETGAKYAPMASLPVPVSVGATAPVRDLGEITARLRAHSVDLAERGLSRIAVFGSFAVGEQTPESDVDLLVEFALAPVGLAYMEPPEFAESILGRAIDWVEPALLRPRLRDRALKEAVYVWKA